METGAITGYIDVAQVVLYAFWVFFAGLILYLRKEDKREGFPLESERSAYIDVIGFPRPPEPKTFLLADGQSVTVPRAEPPRQLAAEPYLPFLGAPLEPTGDPMVDGVGPASFALRSDVPDRTVEGENRILPLRALPDYGLEPRDPDPRGLPVVGADGESGGSVVDVWVDRADPLVRYFEVEVDVPGGEQNGAAADPDAAGSKATRRTLVPVNFAHVEKSRARVMVKAVLGEHFARAPGLASPDQVTLLEEDRISAYFGGGLLYATPQRAEPLI
ncbi:MAG: photosynthetic reaction center subunit H [Pseudomonadales bacterium]